MKKSLRDKITSVVLAGVSLLPSVSIAYEANAKDYTVKTQKRVLELDIDHPFATPQSRAKTTYSANQLTDYVLNKSLSDSLPKRLAKSVADAYLKYLTAYISHEAGHEGKDLSLQADLRKTLTPKVAPTKKSLDTPEKRIKYFSAGLNQNTLNSSLIWENGQRHKNFDDTGFLFNSLYGAFYTPDEGTRSSGNTLNDLEAYCDALEEKGIRENPSRLKARSQIASALTLQNYASIWNALNYTLNGKTNTDPLTFKIKDTEITPPIFSHFLTQKGSYLQSDTFLNPKGKNPIKISAGVQDDKLRAGAKLYDLKATDKLSFNPYIYVDTSGGHSIGSDLEYSLSENLSLTAEIQTNKNDVLENETFEKGNGINITAGLKWAF
jgi:hypothetical protein